MTSIHISRVFPKSATIHRRFFFGQSLASSQSFSSLLPCSLPRFTNCPSLSRPCPILYPHSRRLTTGLTPEGMELGELMKRIGGWLRPGLAASWDNVGLLVEPSPPHFVHRVQLTNDLTEAVLAEAIRSKADMILSYHPPIFKALKRLTQGSWKERIIVGCIEHRIAIYAPHTILDCLGGGVTDWLIEPFGGKPEPLEPSVAPGRHDYSVSVIVSSTCLATPLYTELVQLCAATSSTLHDIGGAGAGLSSVAEGQAATLRVSCKQGALTQIVALLSRLHERASDSLQVVQLAKVPMEGCGEGRITRLAEPLSLHEAVERTKKHLGLKHVRLARTHGQTLDAPISSVAVCAGSGAGVLAGRVADLYVTGEMTHHDVLDATHRGTAVILCEHSNTERGYLEHLGVKLRELLGEGVVVELSAADTGDPLEIV